MNKPLLATMQQCQNTTLSELEISLTPLAMVNSKIAILPVHGLLLHRIEGFGSCYATLRQQLREALESPDVEHIVLDIDSGGGEVNGLFDLVDEIVAAREQKPITALVNEVAYSAAYLIASSAHQIIASQTASVGSIGVIVAHIDQSKANQRQGFTFTEVFAGSHKADCSPHHPLSKRAKADLQAQVDETYEMLLAALAKNRQKPASIFEATEAKVYSSQVALNLQLIDRICSPHKMIEELLMNNDHLSNESMLVAERERVKEILHLCQTVGCVENATHWITSGTCLDDVRKALLETMVANVSRPIVNALGDQPSREHELVHSMIQGLRG